MKSIIKIEEMVVGSAKIKGLILETSDLIKILEEIPGLGSQARRLSNTKWRTEYKLGLTAGGVFTAVDKKSVVSFIVRKHNNKTALGKFLAGAKSDLAKRVLADFDRPGYGLKLQAARMQYARTLK